VFHAPKSWEPLNQSNAWNPDTHFTNALILILNYVRDLIFCISKKNICSFFTFKMTLFSFLNVISLHKWINWIWHYQSNVSNKRQNIIFFFSKYRVTLIMVVFTSAWVKLNFWNKVYYFLIKVVSICAN
jgi:hypothetical protein